MHNIYIIFVLVLALAIRVSAQILSPGDDPSKSDLVHFGDLVDVDEVGSFEFDWSGRLTPEGFLDGFDKVENQIFALCKSETEIAQAIESEYAKTLRNPKVVVRILDRSNRALVLLDGAVKTPQRFRLRRSVTLSELLVISGGIKDNSSGLIRLFRPPDLGCSTVPGKDNVPTTVIIKIEDLLSGKPDANPQILSGDVVSVLEAQPIYIIGGVNVPKQLPMREKTTLTRAIASAGGISKEGQEGEVTIFRRDGKLSVRIEVDLTKIRTNEIPDPTLQAFDVVDVGQKGRERRKFAPVLDVNTVGEISNIPLRIID